MSKEIVHIKYCLLGYGYASLIAYHKLLQKNNHVDVLLIQNEGAKKIFTIEHEGFHFSPLPIFPVAESELYGSSLFWDLPKQDAICVSFSELVNFEQNEHDIKEGSLAAFMLANQGIDQRLCLALKQWGDSMLFKPFSQVQSKIKRHYISKRGNTRVGYVGGKSLYKYAVDKLNPNFLNYSSLEKIDINKKEVNTKNHIIQYDKLISTIPLHYLLELCDLPFGHNTSYADAYFCFFKYDAGLQENQVVYDCDYNSEVIRIFSISDTLLLAQLNGDKRGVVPISKIEARVQELAPNILGLKFAKDLYVPMCYPLEVVDEPNTLESIQKLKKNEVTPLGRFGNWEYSDLHELDWSSLL